MSDIYETITNKIVAIIEANPQEFKLPWHKGGSDLPTNAHTGKTYNGVNVVTLWFIGFVYEHQIWASYQQWQAMGCQVRKGEKGAPIIYYSTFEKEEGDDKKAIPFIKQSSVFNADQVDGYEAPTRPKLPPVERLQAVDEFVTATHATIVNGGSVACYVPALDIIRMPDDNRFFDTETSSRTESYYSTLCHELTHWTMHPKRLNRKAEGDFKKGYAFEELVAELGAAFLCARLSITNEVRQDHANYIGNWLKALRNDKKFIFKASSDAQKAVDYLLPT